jgi:hypothetical protein
VEGTVSISGFKDAHRDGATDQFSPQMRITVMDTQPGLIKKWQLQLAGIER